MLCECVEGLPINGTQHTCLLGEGQYVFIWSLEVYIIGETHFLFVLYRFLIIINDCT